MAVEQLRDLRYPGRGLHGELVRELGRRVVRGEFPPGSSLPVEADLCAELGISRSVVREAMKVLAGKGLVEVRPRTGTRVRPKTEWNLLDPDVLDWRSWTPDDREFLLQLIEARRIIEPAACELAAARVDPGGIERLEEAYADMWRSSDNPAAFGAADRRFHEAIVAGCGNEVLRQLGSSLAAALTRSANMVDLVHTGVGAALPPHRKLLEAIRRGDSAGARTASLELLDHAERELRAVFDRRG